MIPGLNFWLRFEDAVANRSQSDAVSGSENESEAMVASLYASPPAPHFAFAELQIDFASQHWLESVFLRDWRLPFV